MVGYEQIANRCALSGRRRAPQRLTRRVTLASDAGQEQELISLFQAERTDEYNGVRSRVPAFLDEIDHERSRDRATYAEVEESEADLDRLRTWLSRVQSRDYFNAPGGADAVAAVERCAETLAAFEADALTTLTRISPDLLTEFPHL